MDVEFLPNFEEFIRILGDRIEEIERILIEDEEFCNQDIDATYQAALTYLQTFERKFHEKLSELETKLEQLRTANLQTSKENQRQFDEQIEEVNQLFSSGKHQEALDKFHDYEKQFQQRTTIIQNIPKLYMQEIDINRYFSIDKPISTPEIPKPNSLDQMKQTRARLAMDEHEDSEKEELNNPCFDIRYRHSTSQPLVKSNPLPYRNLAAIQPNQSFHFRSKESQSPLLVTTPRSQPFSTRLSSSCSTRSLTTNEHDLSPSSSFKLNSIQNINHHVQVRSTPSSPNILPSVVRAPTSTMRSSRVDGLSLILVAPYQHEQNTSVLMTCNQNSIILLRSQANRLARWYSIIYDRSNPTEKVCQWHHLMIKSIGLINHTHLYLFTDREFLIYSSDLSSKYTSRILLNASNYHSEHHNIHLGFGGIVHNQYICHLYLNLKDHWILSILDLETNTHIYDHDLTERFPDVKQFIDIHINDRMLSFLVALDSSQYAVIFCTNTINSTLQFTRTIPLSYAGNPGRICSIYIPYIQKEIYFINDPSAKIIHLLTQEKYLQSYSIIVHTLCYVEDSHELILTSNDGIYSIHINEQQQFFSKFH